MKLRISSRYPPATFSADGHRQSDIPLVEAIKAVRNVTSLGLKEAKDFVEELADLGRDHYKEVSFVKSLSVSDIQEAVRRLRAADLEVVEVGKESVSAFRVDVRRMITVALEDDNIVLARDLFNLYEKHFTR